MVNGKLVRFAMDDFVQCGNVNFYTAQVRDVDQEQFGLNRKCCQSLGTLPNFTSQFSGLHW